MILTLYSVFQLDGEDYVADVSTVLTSNPPQYCAYRLSDRKHRFIFCSQVSCDRYMYPADFHKFMHGTDPITTLTSNMRGDVTVSHGLAGATITNTPPHVVVHQREKTPIELLEARLQKLEKVVSKLKSRIETT